MADSDGAPAPAPKSVLVPGDPVRAPFRFSIPSASSDRASVAAPPNMFKQYQKSSSTSNAAAAASAESATAAVPTRIPPVAFPDQQNVVSSSSSGTRPEPSTVSRRPAKDPVLSDPNCIIVSRRQEHNALLRHLGHVRWKFADSDSLLCDYLVGNSAGVLYLTLRYHLQCPEYIHARMAPLKHWFRLRILLVLVDLEDCAAPIEDLTRIAFVNNWTMICAFSIPEAAQYVETFKIQENAPLDSIKERIETDHASVFSSILTLIRSVNKTDVVTLAETFGSLAKVMAASVDELSQCPGVGTLKAKRIYDAFRQPFRKDS